MSTQSKELTIIVIRTKFRDWLTSLLNIGVIVGISVANHRWGGGSAFLDALAVVLGFSTLIALTVRKTQSSWRGTVDEAIAHLTTLKNL